MQGSISENIRKFHYARVLNIPFLNYKMFLRRNFLRAAFLKKKYKEFFEGKIFGAEARKRTSSPAIYYL